jgi:hypothetical protein
MQRTMPTETQAIEIAQKLLEEKNINCRFRKALPPHEKFSTWQLVFDLILPENVTLDPSIVVIEVDESGNASFLPII